MFVGRVIPEQEVRGRDPRLPRLPHALQSAVAAPARRLVQRLRAISRHAAARWSRRLGTPDVHFLGHVSNEELTALYDVADLFLCASEHEGFCVPDHRGVLQASAGAGYAATAVPATMDGGGVLYDTKDSVRRWRALMDAVLDRCRARGRGARSHRTRRWSACAQRDFAGTLAPLRRRDARRAAARRRPRSPGISGSSSTQFERLEELRQFRPALYRALPAATAVGTGPAIADASASPAMIINNGSRPPTAAMRSATARGGCATCCARRGTTPTSTR